MPRTTGPLFALDASGTIAKTLTYSRWKGIKYARQRVVPANPRSTDQTEVRTVFSFLTQLFKNLSAIWLEPLQLASANRPLTPANLLIKQNAAALKTQTDLQLLRIDEGSGGAPATPGWVFAATVGHHLTADLTVVNAPAGWSPVSSAMIAVLDQDPHDPYAATLLYASGGVNPSSLDIDASAFTGQGFHVEAFIRFTKPDGSDAIAPAAVDFLTA